MLVEGPSYGYFAEPAKSILIVKEQNIEEATVMFADLEVDIVLASRFLGGCVGKEEGVRHCLRNKVGGWVEAITRLAEAALTYP